MNSPTTKLALVIGQLPTIEEVDQFRLLAEAVDVTVITSASIADYISQTSYFDGLSCLPLPDYEDNRHYLPGLESALANFSQVLVKERAGVYAFQVIKAKWRHRFRLINWIDNAAPFPSEADGDLRTIRRELANATDLYLTSSNAVAKALLLEGIDAAKIAMLCPWVDQITASEGMNRHRYREALRLHEGAFAIAHMGRIEWEEGLADLAAAVKLAADESPSFARRIRLIFCGIGTYAPALRDLLVSFGLDDRAIYLAPSRQSIEHVLHSADMLFLGRQPTRDRIDADPYPFLRAMTHQVPILAHRSPLTDELCGKHRFDYTQGSPASMAKTLLKAIDNPSLRLGVAQRAREVVDTRFTVAKSTASLHEIFLQTSTPTTTDLELSRLDATILEVENKITTKQYLAAIDMIESIFRMEQVPVHHKANLYRLIGDCFAKLGDNESAKDAYVQAVEGDPYNPKAYIGLGTLGLLKRSPNIAVIHFQKAIALAPQDEMANLGLGLAFQDMGEVNEASRWVSKSLDLNPDNTVAIFTIVKMAHESNQFDAAEKALRRYLDRHPGDHNMLFTLGGLLFKRGQYDEVITKMQDLIRIDPLDTRAQSLLKDAMQARKNAEASSGG